MTDLVRLMLLLFLSEIKLGLCNLIIGQFIFSKKNAGTSRVPLDPSITAQTVWPASIKRSYILSACVMWPRPSPCTAIIYFFDILKFVSCYTFWQYFFQRWFFWF